MINEANVVIGEDSLLSDSFIIGTAKVGNPETSVLFASDCLRLKFYLHTIVTCDVNIALIEPHSPRVRCVVRWQDKSEKQDRIWSMEMEGDRIIKSP